MKKPFLYFLQLIMGLLIACVLCTSCQKTTQPTSATQAITQDWQFRSLKKDKQWRSAQVPGTVHTDLLRHELIEPPYYRLNEHDLQWIDKTPWEYKTTFEVSESMYEMSHALLCFEGVDTYSKIYLNDTLLLETDNMFRAYEVECKNLLKPGKNQLTVRFDSPIERAMALYDSLGYTIPVSNNDLAEIGQVTGQKRVSVFARKAGYHFGWDWGPRLVTSGLWRPVTIRHWNNFKANGLYIEQKDHTEKAQLVAHVEVEATNSTDNMLFTVMVDGNSVAQIKQPIVAGKQTVAVPFEIEKPELWWPNGLGAQKLYNVTVSLADSHLYDTIAARIGLRTIKLVTEPDSLGTSFYFEVNGVPVFMKGANYIPQDVFLSEVDKSRYRHILQSAVDANMNMIRVWGGGVYEDDYFYELCDEMGLLVWQDFMFACALFPGDSRFLNSVREEATYNVKRLRNHPSIALWCGNNESLSAWKLWGWEREAIEKQGEAVAKTLWKAYEDVFHRVLPEVVQQYDSTRAYWASSPSSATGVEESTDHGDMHYWGVWWGQRPFTSYDSIMPRFMSEYGFQSFPALSTVNQYTLPEDHDIYSEVMKSHQRSSIGNGTIETYMLRHYRQPKDFAGYLYVSQLLQAYGIGYAMEAHRRQRERCMGSLYWQINDCWPVASWSSIDYYGRWKALHYTTKKAFSKVLVSFETLQDSVKVFIVSDSLKAFDGELAIQMMSFEGKTLNSWKVEANVPGNSSQRYWAMPKAAFDIAKNGSNTLLKASVSQHGKTIAENIVYLQPFKALDLPNPGLTYEISEHSDVYTIHLKTQYLAKNVYLSANLSGNFSENFFDLLPGEEKVVTIPKDGETNLKSFKAGLKVESLVDTYADGMVQ